MHARTSRSWTPPSDPLWSNKYSRRNHLQIEEPSLTSLMIPTNPSNTYQMNPLSPEKPDNKQKPTIVQSATNKNMMKYIVITTNANSVTTMPLDIYHQNGSKTPFHFIITTLLDYDQDALFVEKSDTIGRNVEIINISLVIKTHQDTKLAIALKTIETNMLQQTVLWLITPPFLSEWLPMNYLTMKIIIMKLLNITWQHRKVQTQWFWT